MTLIELCGCAVCLLGAMVLAILGYAEWGWLGGLGGTAIGFLAGWIVVIGFESVTDWLFVRRQRNTRRGDLNQRFGSYWSANQAILWDRLAEHLSVGAPVSGIIVQEYRYGSFIDTFIDTGHGFPALISKLYDDPTSVEEAPGVGAEVLARVAGFDGKEHVIKLTPRNGTDEDVF